MIELPHYEDICNRFLFSTFWRIQNTEAVLNKYTTKIAKYTTQFFKRRKKSFAKYTTKIAKYTTKIARYITQIFHDENC